MNISGSMQAALEETGTQAEWLLWVEAKNRDTGNTEASGIWTGGEDQTFIIDGVSRTYYGAGSLLQLPKVQFNSELDVQTQNITLSILSEEVINMIRVYDSRLAPCELHLLVRDTTDGSVAGITPVIEGWIDIVDIAEGAAPNGEASATVAIVSSVRAGTKVLNLKKSDQSQKLRDATDRGMEYADISGELKIVWGKNTGKPPVQRTYTPYNRDHGPGGR